MPRTLEEYVEWLHSRSDLRWPQPPEVQPLKATPFTRPLPGIRAVAWSVYGTLLRIDTGRLQLLHPQPLRMQIALQKTIEEFKIWNSMSRKPGQPWEYLLRQYAELVENAGLAGTARRGDVPQIDAAAIWKKLIERLQRNGYVYDVAEYGERDALAAKVAYFFHASLQGVAAASGVVQTLGALQAAGVRNALLADTQAFTLPQMLRAFRQQNTLAAIDHVLVADCFALSHRAGVRLPSPSLFLLAAEQFSRQGMEPSEVLVVSHRLEDVLAPARRLGFRTAFVAADAGCTHVDKQKLRSPDVQPDRLITDIPQILRIAGL